MMRLTQSYHTRALVPAVRGGQTSSGDAVREAICPYRGLDAFREEDSAFFFGRGSADDPKRQGPRLPLRDGGRAVG
jgi:hypothetical protein